MFITKEDFKVVASEAALKTIMQDDSLNADNAIEEAIEEISGYLRTTYDCQKAFAMEGNDRNKQLVMYTADIALYNMTAAMPQRMGSEVRKERYDRAIRWLEGVQQGKIVPNLPLNTDPDGTAIPASGLLAYGAGPDRHHW